MTLASFTEFVRSWQGFLAAVVILGALYWHYRATRHALRNAADTMNKAIRVAADTARDSLRRELADLKAKMRARPSAPAAMEPAQLTVAQERTLGMRLDALRRSLRTALSELTALEGDDKGTASKLYAMVAAHSFDDLKSEIYETQPATTLRQLQTALDELKEPTMEASDPSQIWERLVHINHLARIFESQLGLRNTNSSAPAAKEKRQ